MLQTPEEFMRDYERATKSHRLEATLSMIDEKAIYLFSDESAHIGKPAIERVFRRNFDAIHDEMYSIANLAWLVQSEEVAVCVYDFIWSGIINGEPASGSGHVTSVLERSSETWKVIHEHLSRGKFIA